MDTPPHGPRRAKGARITSRASLRGGATAFVIVGSMGLMACAGGPSNASPAPTRVSVERWQELATARPTPLDGAPRISVGTMEVLGETAWAPTPDLGSNLLLSELVVAGLLRRRDIEFVERRRFAAAAAAERAGAPIPNAPPVGTSPGPDLEVLGSWIPLGTSSASLELRLVSPESGAVESTWRTTINRGGGPVGVARAVVRSLADHLEEMGRLPDQQDATITESASAAGSTQVRTDALAAFTRGLAHEEAWRWDGARMGYEEALAADPGFHEAAAALARTARLRLGGSLGAS